MNVLVTGGCGYIGSHVVDHLKRDQNTVTVLDNLSTGFRESVSEVQLHVCDLNDEEKLRDLLSTNKFDACIHFAASLLVNESVSDPIKYYLNNTANSARLIGLCYEYGIKKFIFSSTAATYGIPEEGICREENSVNPINPYGRSKLMVESILKDFVVTKEDFRYVILRYFNVAGASTSGQNGQRTKNATHLIKLACMAACEKSAGLKIFGTDYPTDDGTCYRDYIHVDDLAAAHISALNYLERGGTSDLFNCGYGKGYSVREVIDCVKKVSGKDFIVEESERREGDPPYLVAANEKIKAVLNWSPEFDNLETIVRTALEWEAKLD